MKIYIETRINDMNNLIFNKFIRISSDNENYFVLRNYLSSTPPFTIEGYDDDYNYQFRNISFHAKSYKEEICIIMLFDSFSKIIDKSKFKKEISVYVTKYYIDNNCKNNLSWTEDNFMSCYLGGVKVDLSISKKCIYVVINTKSSKDEMKLGNILDIFFVYHYFVTGKFLQREDFTSKKHANKLVSEELISSKFNNDIKSKNYSRMLVSLTQSAYLKGLESFHAMNKEVSYSLYLFILSQTIIEYPIQQRVSIILNALEGIIKNEIAVSSKKEKFSNSKKRKIVKLINDEMQKQFESEKFEIKVNEILGSEKLGDEIIRNVKEHFTRLNELEFSDVLNESQKISPIAKQYVTDSKIKYQFWQTCKNHRNFFAHLPDREFNGFNKYESKFAMITLSNYYRMIMLELINLSDCIKTESISDIINDVETWSKNKNLSNGKLFD